MKKNKIYVLISILTVIILLSTSALCNFCGTRDTEPSVENITGELASGEIISSEDVEVYLPPDFQKDQPSIYISEVTRGLPSPPLGSDSVGDAYEITSESELAGPVMITLDYDPGDLPSGASEDNLYIATLSGENWEIVPDGFIDTERHTVSATVGHFSNFWVMAFEKGKESIDDLYNKATSTFYKETPRFYSDLPREIRDDLEYNLVKPEEVKAVTEFHIQYFAKLAYGYRPYLDALSKTAGLALAVWDGSKKAVLEAATTTILGEIASRTGSEAGTALLLLYDTVDMASEIGSVALDVSAGTATLTTKSGVYFLNRAMDFINANMHKAFEEIENIGAPLQNLQLYSVFIDSAPIGNLPGMMGVIFYYYDIYDEVWLLFYEDLVYWNVEVRVDGETQQPEPLEQSEGMEAPAEEEEFEETGESAEPEIFDSGGLIAFYDCPYDLTINVGENFSKVEIWHYNSEGDIFKYGGWQSWLKVNDSLVYEWLEFEEGVDSVWYDHTQDENFYGKDDPDDFTDVTDYIYPGENTITFYHYNEGDGSGMVIKVYY